jgi:hypothetical protein
MKPLYRNTRLLVVIVVALQTVAGGAVHAAKPEPKPVISVSAKSESALLYNRYEQWINQSASLAHVQGSSVCDMVKM